MTSPQPRLEPREPAPDRRQPVSIRTWVIRGVVAILIVAAIIWGVKTYLYSRSHETTDDAQIAGHLVPSIPKVSGYVQRVYVADNQLVLPGDTLVTLDPRDYRVALQRAEADLQAAYVEGRRGSGAAQVTSAEAQHTALTADVVAAKANFDRATQDLGRNRELAAKNIVSQQQLDQAVAAEKAAAAQLAAASAQVLSGAANVTGATFQVRNADYRIAGAQAAVENARLQLAYTTLTAPVKGYVAKKAAEVGQFVQAGQQLVAVVESDTSWVVANMKETQLNDIAPGQDAEVTVDAFKGAPIHGKVQSVQDATGAVFALLPPDNATGNFTKIVQRVPVKIVLDSTSYHGRPLSPGLSVEVSVDVTSDTMIRKRR